MSLQPATIFLEADKIIDYPITLSQIKLQARIDGNGLDAIIQEVHLPAAVSWAEGYLHRSVVSRVWRWGLAGFPRTRLKLPQGKAQSIASIAYVSGGATTTLTGPSTGSPEGTDYQEDLRGDKGAIVMPVVGGDWPDSDSDVPTPVVVTFTAGWTEATTPPEVIQAIVRHIIEAINEGPSDGKSVEYLISPLRLIGWG